MQSVTDRSLTASLLYGNTVYIRQDIQNMAYHLKYIISSNFTWLLDLMLP